MLQYNPYCNKAMHVFVPDLQNLSTCSCFYLNAAQLVALMRTKILILY